MADTITIRGAREHNLRNVDLELPRDRLIVFTGISGSGKSSLAFDTIYAEGQRRYVESLSAYARQFLGQMDKPDVDFIEGLSPAISIDQKSASRNPRSTVGTITEIYDYLRLLYARIGIPHCPKCGRVITRQTPQQIVDRVLELAEGTRFQVLAPVVRGRKGEYEGAAQGARAGRASPAPASTASSSSLGPAASERLARYEKHTIEVVVDRLVRRTGIERRLTDSLETALAPRRGCRRGRDRPRATTTTASPRRSRSREHLACTHCGLSFDELAPRNFSFNSPYGACERCDGLGTRFEVDPELVVPDDDLSPRRRRDRAVDRVPQPLLRPRARRGRPRSTASRSTTPWKKLSKKATEGACCTAPASTQRARSATATGTAGSASYTTRFEGVVPVAASAATPRPRATARASRSRATCARCRAPRASGARLARRRSRVTVGGQNIYEVGELSIRNARRVPRGALELSERDRHDRRARARRRSTSACGSCSTSASTT